MEATFTLKESATHRPSVAVLKKIFKFAGNFGFVILLVFGAFIGAFALQNKSDQGAVLPGRYSMYIVLSGSMSPAFDAKSLIFIRPVAPENLVKGDIVTFRTPGSKNLTTHRIVEINQHFGELSFVTKGDANKVNDPNPLYPENIVGKVDWSVPYLGFLLNYSQTRNGMFFMVILPCILIIAHELTKLLRYALKALHEKRSAATAVPAQTVSTPSVTAMESIESKDTAESKDQEIRQKNTRVYEEKLSEQTQQRQFFNQREFVKDTDYHIKADTLHTIRSELQAQIRMMEEIMERRCQSENQLDYNPQ